MIASIISLSILGLSSVHGLALDRLPKSPADSDDPLSSPDLLIRTTFPPVPNMTISYARRSPIVFGLHSPRPIAHPEPSSANLKRTPTPSANDAAPTPAPTGDPSALTTVHISDESDFALLFPRRARERISEAESDGVAYCSKSGCANTFPDGLITGSAVKKADDGSWIQITGCLNPSLYPFAANDDGGQFDVRFPDGAQCSFGGYGASFIEQVEPSASRFCLRCCSSANDQNNCNSHQSEAGCLVTVKGTYKFGDVDCSG